jgi:hypothetical protein
VALCLGGDIKLTTKTEKGNGSIRLPFSLFSLCLGGYILKKSDLAPIFWAKFYHNKTKSQ